MQINVTTRHGHLSEMNQAKIREKVERLPRYFDRISAIAVVVDLEQKDSVRVDLQVSAEHAPDFVAHDIAEELIRAVDGATQKMEQQLRKFKEKHQEPRSNHDARGNHLPQPIDNDADEESDSDQ